MMTNAKSTGKFMCLVDLLSGNGLWISVRLGPDIGEYWKNGGWVTVGHEVGDGIISAARDVH